MNDGETVEIRETSLGEVDYEIFLAPKIERMSWKNGRKTTGLMVPSLEYVYGTRRPCS